MLFNGSWNAFNLVATAASCQANTSPFSPNATVSSYFDFLLGRHGLLGKGYATDNIVVSAVWRSSSGLSVTEATFVQAATAFCCSSFLGIVAC